mmetsp:Transcript_127258/g.366021  ORF Transcript_127258/g.366021 Transcript_127258/m.366021 type:complete len:333 (-) Transcript_127258:1375-2373(-)
MAGNEGELRHEPHREDEANDGGGGARGTGATQGHAGAIDEVTELNAILGRHGVLLGAFQLHHDVEVMRSVAFAEVHGLSEVAIRSEVVHAILPNEGLATLDLVACLLATSHGHMAGVHVVPVDGPEGASAREAVQRREGHPFTGAGGRLTRLEPDARVRRVKALAQVDVLPEPTIGADRVLGVMQDDGLALGLYPTELLAEGDRHMLGIWVEALDGNAIATHGGVAVLRRHALPTDMFRGGRRGRGLVLLVQDAEVISRVRLASLGVHILHEAAVSHLGSRIHFMKHDGLAIFGREDAMLLAFPEQKVGRLRILAQNRVEGPLARGAIQARI